MKNVLYRWWKQKPSRFRRPLVFVLGILLVVISPIVGSVPGPGGIAIFALAIAILGSEFDWALQLKSLVLHTIPREVKNRWRPTPRWQFWFDVTGLVLLGFAGYFAYISLWWPMTSFGATGVCLALFNRDRLGRFKLFLRKKT